MEGSKAKSGRRRNNKKRGKRETAAATTAAAAEITTNNSTPLPASHNVPRTSAVLVGSACTDGPLTRNAVVKKMASSETHGRVQQRTAGADVEQTPLSSAKQMIEQSIKQMGKSAVDNEKLKPIVRQQTAKPVTQQQTVKSTAQQTAKPAIQQQTVNPTVQQQKVKPAMQQQTLKSTIQQTAKPTIQQQKVKQAIQQTTKPVTLQQTAGQSVEQMVKPAITKQAVTPTVQRQNVKSTIQQTPKPFIQQATEPSTTQAKKTNFKHTTKPNTEQTTNPSTKQIAELEKGNRALRDEFTKLRADIMPKATHEPQACRQRLKDQPDETPRMFVARINSEMHSLREEWHLLQGEVKGGRQRLQAYPNETPIGFVSRIDSQLESVRQEWRLFYEEVKETLEGMKTSLELFYQQNSEQESGRQYDDLATQDQMAMVQAILESQQAALVGQQQVLEKQSIAGVECPTERDSFVLTDILSRLERLELRQMHAVPAPAIITQPKIVTTDKSKPLTTFVAKIQDIELAMQIRKSPILAHLYAMQTGGAQRHFTAK